MLFRSVKRLEELGIGRPSTYASIISVIRDRGYVRMQGKQLVPTFLAFLTMDVLENGFGELIDLGFTARMDEGLDEIAKVGRTARPISPSSSTATKSGPASSR